jgi:hypothetical protein
MNRTEFQKAMGKQRLSRLSRDESSFLDRHLALVMVSMSIFIFFLAYWIGVTRYRNNSKPIYVSYPATPIPSPTSDAEGCSSGSGPGGIVAGSYPAQDLTQEQRNWLYHIFGNQGEAPVGYGGENCGGAPDNNCPPGSGPGGIVAGSYPPQDLTQDQRNWLYHIFGNSGEASVGYGGENCGGGSAWAPPAFDERTPSANNNNSAGSYNPTPDDIPLPPVTTAPLLFGSTLPVGDNSALITAIGGLNMRGGPSSHYRIIATVIYNNYYEVMDDPIDGWYHIQHDEQDGWVNGSHVIVLKLDELNDGCMAISTPTPTLQISEVARCLGPILSNYELANADIQQTIEQLLDCEVTDNEIVTFAAITESASIADAISLSFSSTTKSNCVRSIFEDIRHSSTNSFNLPSK